MRRPLETVLPGTQQHQWKDFEWLRPQFLDENEEAILSVNTYVLEVGGRVIVVDTGHGNGKIRHVYQSGNQVSTDFLERLTVAGTAPSRVDTVQATHLTFTDWPILVLGSHWPGEPVQVVSDGDGLRVRALT